jgi:hypothetical protein
MTPEEKEEQYAKMGCPNLRRKKIHFKTIKFFSQCIIKYFTPVLKRVLFEEKDDYGGLKDIKIKFLEAVR